jgi:ribose 5-phosphate isomerase A
MNGKQVAALKAVEYIKDGMTIGLGTGSTAYWAIQYIGERVSKGLRIRAIATSIQSESLARELAIPLLSFSEFDSLDLTIDGADEVDLQLQLIKGGGGALLREKMVASVTKFYVIIVDESKRVTQLGKFKVPVEIIPFAWELTRRRLEKLGAGTTLRMANEKLFVTDNGNFILDCDFGLIQTPEDLHHKINEITGVVDNGLFVNLADIVLVGKSDGGLETLQRN